MQPTSSRRILLLLSALAVWLMACGGLLPRGECQETVATPQGDPPTDSASAEEIVAEVRIVGNETISTAQVASNLTARAGRPFEPSVVSGDVRRLMGLGWFVDVRTHYEKTAAGRVVVYEVVERPTIRWVNYLGNEDVKDKKLAKETGIELGGSVDPYAVQEGARKIREYYQGRGYNNVQVTVLEGAKHSDQGVTYLIHEGEKQRIWSVKFEGNEFFSNGTLKKYVQTKPPIMKLFKGYLDRDQIQADQDSLTAVYRSFGFFRASVGAIPKYNKNRDWVNLTFVIEEGERYNVRSVRLDGNTKFETSGVVSNLELSAGEPFEQASMQKDQIWLQELYGSHGYVFADVRPETIFLEEPGEVDLVYRIDEGRQFRVGRIFVHIAGDSPHTRIQTALNRFTLQSGDILDIRELKASERRLQASSLFHVDPATGVRPKITYRIPDDAELPSSGLASRNTLRGQSPPPSGPAVLPPPSSAHLNGFQHGLERISVTAKGDVHVYCDDFQHYRRWVKQESEGLQSSPAAAGAPNSDGSATAPSNSPDAKQGADADAQIVTRGQSPQKHPADRSQLWWVPTGQARSMKPVTPSYESVRGQSPQSASNAAYSGIDPNQYAGRQIGGQTVRPTDPMSASIPVRADQQVQPAQYSSQIQPPAGSITPTPLSNQGPLPPYSVFPDGRFGVPGQPYPSDRVDIYIEGQETQTGRLMMGVGINSDAGVVGNIVVDERNFDWRRFPTSVEDFRNGRAFRGDGQRFRIDASPGSEVNRYIASWQNPYLFDRPITLGLSGSYFDRRFRDWDEQRLGGRVSLGRQWVERDFAATISYRGENVNIHDPSTLPGSVPELDEVIGDNVLHGFKLTLINDTRDSAFLATQGHYIEVGGEQVIGTFDYPRVTMDLRKFFLIRERPDHSGRHVLSIATNVGYSGTHTPIYEHFFAGGFSTMRGFDFRGASPVVGGVEVGGEFQWINSVQYLFPVTADDMLHGVVFCDFGTVEQDVTIRDFRVAPGVGLRITVPAMGPAPIALDFAWAVNHADFDDREVFSFSVGFGRF